MKQKFLPFKLLPQTAVPMGAVLAAIVAAVTLYLYKLGGFVAHSPAEAQTAAMNAAWRTIAGNPLNLPYKVVDYIMLHLPFGSLESRSRLASVVIALACATVFFLLVRRWHGTRNASLATTLFVTAGWFLHTGRFGTGLVMLSFMVLGLTAMSAWISAAQPQGKGWVLVFYGVSAAAALLVPAGLWFVLASAIIVRPKLLEHFRASSAAARFASVATPVLALSLVVVALVRHPELYRQWIGLPAELPDIITIGKQAVMSLSFLVARGPFMPEVWLAHTPLLDIASAALFLAGALFYIKRRNNARVHLLAIYLAIGSILVALHGAPALAYTAPIVYLLIATGLTYLSYQWLTVFPKNPFARGLAMLLISAIVLTTVVYHTQRYFMAWRYSPDTAAAYRTSGDGLHRSNLIQ